MNRVQNTKESISEYAHALRTLGGKCFPDLTVDALSKFLLGIFVNGIHQKYRVELLLRNPQTFEDAIAAAQQIESALSSVGSLAHTGLVSTTTEQTAQMDQLIKTVATLSRKINAQEGSSAAIGPQQSTIQATQSNPQIGPQFDQSPQFNLQFDSYKYQAVPTNTNQYQYQAVPLPPNPYYPQQNYDGYRSFPENNPPTFNPSTQSYCTNCRKFGHDTTRCWGREPPRYPQNWRGAPNNRQWISGPGRGQVPQNNYYGQPGSVPVYNFTRRNPPQGRGTYFSVPSVELSNQTSNSSIPNPIQLFDQMQPPIAMTTEASNSEQELTPEHKTILQACEQILKNKQQDIPSLTYQAKSPQTTQTCNQYSDQNVAGGLVQESSTSLVKETSNPEPFEPPKSTHEKLPRGFPIMTPEAKRAISKCTWTYPIIDSLGIPTNSSNTINSCVQTEPTDPLTEPAIFNHSDPLKQTVSCSTPSQPAPTSRKKQEKPVESVEPNVPSQKPSVKSWFKSLANGFKSLITKKHQKLDKSCNTLVTANTLDSDSSHIIETSDSDFEPSPEKVISFRQVEEVNTPEVDESDAESWLPPLVYQKMKGKIITNFLANRGSQKQSRSHSQKRKGRKSNNSQIRSSQQKQPSQSLSSNISDRAKEHVVESPTRISKDQICSNAMGPIGRFKDGTGSDAVGRDEHSEYSEDSEDFEKEMNPSEMNLSKMNPCETNPSVTLAERNDKTLEIVMK